MKSEQARSCSDPYDRIAAFYDLGMGEFQDDLALYQGFAQRSAGPVLELGCGSGRLLSPLAQSGCSLIGVDRSAAMLEVARNRLAGQGGLDINLLQADMRGLPLTGHFGLIFVAIDSFLHLGSSEDQLACLRAVRSLLAGDGVLVIDLPAPGAPGWEDWSAGIRPVVLAWSVVLPDGSRVSKYSSFTADPSTQSHSVTETYERTGNDGLPRRWTVEYELRFVFPAELELLLEAAGLQLKDRYGDYDLGPFEAGCPRQICVAAR